MITRMRWLQESLAWLRRNSRGLAVAHFAAAVLASCNKSLPF